MIEENPTTVPMMIEFKEDVAFKVIRGNTITEEKFLCGEVKSVEVIKTEIGYLDVSLEDGAIIQRIPIDSFNRLD